MSDLVNDTLAAIKSGNDKNFTRECMGDGKMKKDKADDVGHKKGKQPNDTGGKPAKLKRVK